MTTTTGLFTGVPPAEYHERRIGVVSKSALDLIARSPAHYKAWIDGHDATETPALTFGAAFHCALLEPERFAVAYGLQPDFGDCRYKAAREERDAWREANSTRLALSPEDSSTIVRMRDAVLAHPLAGKMVRDGQAELTVRWRDEPTGLECKSRADYYVERFAMVADVKTTIDASPDAFRKSVASFRYHVQDALYRAGFAAAGAPLRHFVFIAVEKAPPFAVATYSLDDDATDRGSAAARREIDTMAKCVKSGEWPGYESMIRTLHIPPWAA